MSAWFISYVLIGPCAWFIFIYAMIAGRRRMNVLERPIVAPPAPSPRACVLVPVKDEVERIRESIESILAQGYDNFRVIAIDDRSVDGTAEVLDQIEGIEIIHIGANDLPAGWAGKPHALHVAVSRNVREDDTWLVFVDSDVALAPDVIAGAIGVCEQRKYDMLSLLPRLECRTFWERLLMPLCGTAICAIHLAAYTNDNRLRRISFANGQFICMRRTVYEAIGGHAAVRGTFSEDIAIAQNLKRAGYRPRISNGEEFATTRMYDSLGGMMHGWARNFFSGSMGRPWRLLFAIAFVGLSLVSFCAALAFGWYITALVHCALMLFATALPYHWTKNSIGYALLFPLGAAMLVTVWLRALRFCITRRVEWRGTTYAYQIGTGVVPR